MEDIQPACKPTEEPGEQLALSVVLLHKEKVETVKQNHERVCGAS